LFSHYSYQTLSNCYLIGPDEPGDAVLVDPSVFDVDLLGLIESHKFYVKTVLLTHTDEQHLAGLKTIRRVYDCNIYAARSSVMGFDANPVTHDEVLNVCCAPIEVIGLPGHARDSVAYYVAGLLFTGVAMSAAECGTTANAFARAVLLQNIGERILSLPETTVVLPFYGPPSTIGVERRTFPMKDPDDPAAEA
jgi:glyoxylase-like metal-dependent hydrolase (beta-lactamase superfamily II)